MRHIPLIHQLCSHPMLRSTYIYIQNCSSYFFHVVFALYPETLSTCHLRMRPSRTTYFEVQRHFGVILSSMWCVLVRDSATQSETLPLKLDTDGSQNGVDAFKGNGGRHTLIAPYQPRSYGQADVLFKRFSNVSRRRGAIQ